MDERGEGDALDAIASWLAGSGEAPPEVAELARSAHSEVVILRALCRGRRARARAAADVLVELLARSGGPDASPPTGGGGREGPSEVDGASSGASFGHWSEGLRDASGAAERVLALEDEVARLSPWLGIGWHREGSALVDVVHDRLDVLTALLARREDLARIAATLGRLEASERHGRGAERGGRETVVGVRFAGELGDVLPNELALLSDPDTEDVFYARLAERQLLSLELTGELEGQVRTERRPGPVIACVDTSGSLIGAAEEVGKAATLAVLRRVLGSGRRARVLLFGGRDSLRELELRPGHADARALFDFLLASFHGGTDVDAPLTRALALRAAEPGLARADVLLVTDGVARLRGATQAAVKAARRDGMRVVLVLVGDRGSLLGDLADEVVRVAV